MKHQSKYDSHFEPYESEVVDALLAMPMLQGRNVKREVSHEFGRTDVVVYDDKDTILIEVKTKWNSHENTVAVGQLMMGRAAFERQRPAHKHVMLAIACPDRPTVRLALILKSLQIEVIEVLMPEREKRIAQGGRVAIDALAAAYRGDAS